MCREFTTIERNEPLQKRSLKRFMVVLLKIEGNSSTFRAKLAYFVGHLPLVTDSGHLSFGIDVSALLVSIAAHHLDHSILFC